MRFQPNQGAAFADKVWGMITEGDRLKFSMTTACCYRRYNAFNLYSGHAYTLLGGTKLSNGKRIVAIRNPHGREKYKGAWGDDDTKSWTDKHKQEVKTYRFKNDGTFHMLLEDYMTEFNSFAVLYYRDNWKTSKFRYKGKEGSTSLEIDNGAE